MPMLEIVGFVKYRYDVCPKELRVTRIFLRLVKYFQILGDIEMSQEAPWTFGLSNDGK